MFVNFQPQHPRTQPGSDDDSDDGEDVLDPESGSKNPQFQLTCQIYSLYLLLYVRMEILPLAKKYST